jgi:hypothetical protein
MARKSAAALSIPPVPGRGRPEPPRSLDRLEKRAWREVVGSLPDRWCDPSAQGVLRRAVAQAAVSERLEIRLRELRAQNLDDPADATYATTVAAHREASKSAAYLLSHLRATPKSRMASREARTAVEQAPTTKPWLVKG